MERMDTTKEEALLLEIPFHEDLLNQPLVQEKRQIIPYVFAKTRGVLPIDEQEDTLVVAHLNPYDLELIEEMGYLTGFKICEVLTTKKALDEAIEHCYHQKEHVASELVAALHEGSQTSIEEEGYDLLAQKADSPLIQLLNAMLTEAIQQGASDIHFEPTENGLTVRYRIDGVLQPRHAPPKEYQSQLITRIKVMAALDIAEHRLPQDGRIKLNLGGRAINFRVSTIPVVYGERIVLRILDKSNVVLGLNKIGMRSTTLESFLSQIRSSEGIVLVTGPTGSGKTTTLYSALSEMPASEVNIMTIEDPVEYKLAGMAQMGVNPKINLSFATGLRHILRQDPDVIMIGEIRDKETAEIAIQSSLTGHLVLSTLHTNDAPSALTRLVDMGIEPYLLSSSVLAVLAQRLLRLNCPHCKESYTPSDQEILQLGIDKHHILHKGKGCAQCYYSGYKGRHGIYELMVMNNRLKQQLLRSADAVILHQVAVESGMSTLRAEGIRLALEGKTSVCEVLRVTRYGGADGAISI